MSYYLFLDDIRYPSQVNWVSLPENVEWKIVRSFDEFTNFIKVNGLPKFISFDHDLADEHYKLGHVSAFTKFDYNKVTEKTGYHCAKWLVEYCLERKLPPPNWVTHSMNPIGCENINSILKSYQKSLD